MSEYIFKCLDCEGSGKVGRFIFRRACPSCAGWGTSKLVIADNISASDRGAILAHRQQNPWPQKASNDLLGFGWLFG